MLQGRPSIVPSRGLPQIWRVLPQMLIRPSTLLGILILDRVTACRRVQPGQEPVLIPLLDPVELRWTVHGDADAGHHAVFNSLDVRRTDLAFDLDATVLRS